MMRDEALSFLRALARTSCRLPLPTLIILSGFTYCLAGYWSTDDDHMNFFLTGRAILHSEDVAARFDTALTSIREADLDETGIREIEIREKNLHSYLIPSAFYAITAELVEELELAPRGSQYFWHVIVASALGFWPPFLLAAALLILTLRAVEPSLRNAATVTLGVMLVALFVFDFSGYLTVATDGPRDTLEALVNPGVAFGLFGITPRSNFVLLAFAIFLLRMDSRFGPAYALLFLAILFHRQQGGVLLALCLAVDMIMRPRLFVRPGLLVWPIVTAGYFLVAETTWEQIGVSAQLGAALFVAALGLVLALVSLERWRAGAVGSGAADSGLFGLAAVVRDDRVILVSIWVCLLGASVWAVSRGIGGEFFWPLLPGRTLMILQPILPLSIVLWLQRLKPGAPSSRLTPPGLVTGIRGLAAIILILTVLDSLARHVRIIPWPLGLDYEQLTRSRFGISTRVDHKDEQRLYFAIAKSIDTHDGLFERMILATVERTPDATIALDDKTGLTRLVDDGFDLNKSRRWAAPGGWPSAWFEATPYVAALVWKSNRLAKEIAQSTEERRPGPSSALLCDAVWDQMRYSNRDVLPSLVRASTPDALNAPCARYDYPPICVSAREGVWSVVLSLARSGVDLWPPGGCNSDGANAIAVLEQTYSNDDLRGVLTELAGDKLLRRGE